MFDNAWLTATCVAVVCLILVLAESSNVRNAEHAKQAGLGFLLGMRTLPVWPSSHKRRLSSHSDALHNAMYQ